MKKHIVCLGDSNTHGYCAEPEDCEDGGIRFSENERWTKLLQNKLGDDYLVIEEGLPGRTTVFPDPLHENLDAISIIYAILKSHQPIDLLIIMLGTNDTKERFCVNAACIGLGMQRLVRKTRSIDCWALEPNILIVSPPPIGRELSDPAMGEGCAEKSEGLSNEFQKVSLEEGAHFFDAKDCEFNKKDFMHLSKRGHAQLAEKLHGIVTELV